MSRKEDIGHLYFDKNKSTVEIAKKFNINKSTVSRILINHYSERYAAEKELRKNENKEKRKDIKRTVLKEKREAKKYDAAECHFQFRDRPLAPHETLSTVSLINWCRQSFTNDADGTIHFDRTRGGISKDVPSSYDPNSDLKNKYRCKCIAIVLDTKTNEKVVYENIKYNIMAYDDYIASTQARNRFKKKHIDLNHELVHFFIEKIEKVIEC